MTENNQDGRVMLGWLVERKSNAGGTYFKGYNFGATDLLMTPAYDKGQ
jgi:hypothetical protein